MRDVLVLLQRTLAEALAPARLPWIGFALLVSAALLWLASAAGLGRIAMPFLVLLGAFAFAAASACVPARDRETLSGPWLLTLAAPPGAHALAAALAGALLAMCGALVLGLIGFAVLAASPEGASLAPVTEVPRTERLVARPGRGERPAEDITLALPAASRPGEQYVVDFSILYSASSGNEDFVTIAWRVADGLPKTRRLARRDELAVPLPASPSRLTISRPDPGNAVVVRRLFRRSPAYGPLAGALRFGLLLGIVAAAAATATAFVSHLASPTSALMAGVGWLLAISLAGPVAGLAAGAQADGGVGLARAFLASLAAVLPPGTPFDLAAFAARGEWRQGGFGTDLAWHLLWILLWTIAGVFVAATVWRHRQRTGKTA